MNEAFEESGNVTARNHGDRRQIEEANVVSVWKERLQHNWLIVLLGSIVVSFLLGYLLSQEQEAKKQEQWAEILFRQIKNWLAERGRETVGSVEEGLEQARLAAKQAVHQGAKYSRQLNPFQKHARRRYFGIL